MQLCLVPARQETSAVCRALSVDLSFKNDEKTAFSDKNPENSLESTVKLSVSFEFLAKS